MIHQTIIIKNPKTVSHNILSGSSWRRPADDRRHCLGREEQRGARR
jgi:hypothetical protein